MSSKFMCKCLDLLYMLLFVLRCCFYKSITDLLRRRSYQQVVLAIFSGSQHSAKLFILIMVIKLEVKDMYPVLFPVLLLTGVFSDIFLFFLRFYLFIHERHRERQRHRHREKQAPHGEHDVGLDPSTPGSCSEPKADAQPLSHPDILMFFYTYMSSLYT